MIASTLRPSHNQCGGPFGNFELVDVLYYVVVLQLLILLMLANGAPVVAKRIFGKNFAQPLDWNIKFVDSQPLFGTSKTIRGILAAISITSAAAPLLGLSPLIGLVVATTAMAGDLFSSFLKRRIGLQPSSKAVGLDQIPESLFPLLACRQMLSLTALDVIVGTAIFFVGELVLSRVLFSLVSVAKLVDFEWGRASYADFIGITVVPCR
jgi:hypothetical protein